MEKIKALIRKPVAWICLAVILCAASALFIPQMTATGIDDIEGYEDIFTDVEKIAFYHNSNNFFTTLAPAEKLRELKGVKIVSEPASEDRSTSRDSEYRIAFEDKNENRYVLSISGDFTELWLDDTDAVDIRLMEGTVDVDEGRPASFTYSVRNPKALKKLFPEDE